MRIALIADVHGNSVALDAVVADLERVEPDKVVFLGDAATNGPDPQGAVQRLRRIPDARYVLGNTDADILETPSFYRPPERDRFPEATQKVLEISLWGHEQLDDRDLEFVRSFQPTLELGLPSTRNLVCFHGSPRSATDVITATTADAELDAMLPDAHILAGGHTHVPLLRRHGAQTVLNPGSVGLPFASYGPAGHVSVLPRAQYCVLHATVDRETIEFRDVPLALDLVADAAHHSGMPHADWWLSLWEQPT